MSRNTRITLEEREAILRLRLKRDVLIAFAVVFICVLSPIFSRLQIFIRTSYSQTGFPPSNIGGSQVSVSVSEVGFPDTAKDLGGWGTVQSWV